MKILLLSDVPMDRPDSGAEQVLYRQARGLAEAGARVSAVTRTDGKAPTRYKAAFGVREGRYCLDRKNPFHLGVSLFREPARIFDRFNREGGFDVRPLKISADSQF